MGGRAHPETSCPFEFLSRTKMIDVNFPACGLGFGVLDLVLRV